MTTETIVDAPAEEPAATKEVDAQPSIELQPASEAPSETPVEAAVEDSAPACETVRESLNGDAPLKDEESSKKDAVDPDVVATESASVDINVEQQGFKFDFFD